ncbi:DUF4174 domain-containing protein [Thalassovita sp.]|uniref:DUF4174 domain-containing protein n=1 Tax=Thalassovita sp. TaxID=1979401 RepID=UPI002AAFF966|nr:DUF4174 domain-containing protein [Thalassovita sp.]
MRRVFGILTFLALPVLGGTSLAAQEATVAETAPADAAEPVTVAAPALPIVDSADVTLDDFLWVKRPIVVFADAAADPRFVEQMRFLESDIEELVLRDVVVMTDTDRKSGSALRKKLRPRGFMLALIDKDGEVKLRKPAPWTVREITRSIDKWPTRQQEIREQLGKE